MCVRREIHKWSDKDCEYLKAELLAGTPYRVIADKLGVSVCAVDNRRQRLGLPSHTQVLEGLNNAK